MDRFRNKILKYIRENELIDRGDSVTVGFSGGADSVCLFTVLHELKNLLGIRLQAVHVNHNLRGTEARRDEDFCRELAAAYGETFYAVSVDVTGYAAEHGLTEEEAGRILRYEALKAKAAEFAGECRADAAAGHNNDAAARDDSKVISSDTQHGKVSPADSLTAYHGNAGMTAANGDGSGGRALIAVAHHADDQAETVLLNLMRGSGIRGLGGIRARRGNIIRPMLGVSRSDITAYLDSRGIAYVNDSTNFENDHTRNRLRNIIIPELKEYVNAAASERIAATAAMLQDADDYISKEARAYVRELGEPKRLSDAGSAACSSSTGSYKSCSKPDAGDRHGGRNDSDSCSSSGGGASGKNTANDSSRFSSDDCCSTGFKFLALNQTKLKQKERIFRRYAIIETLKFLGVPLKDWGERHFADIDKALFSPKGFHIDLPCGVQLENAYRETILYVPEDVAERGR